MSQFGGGGGKPNAWGRPGAGGTQLPGFGSLGGVGGFPMMGMGMPMINQNAFQQQGMMSMGVMGAVPQQQGRLPQQQQPQNTTSTLGSSSAVTNKNRAFVGVVTKMHDSYGFVDDDVFFQHTVIRGAHPRVGDKVMVEASYNPQMPFKWNAYRVQLLTGPGSGGGDMLPHQSARGPSPINMGGMQNQRNSGPNIQSGGPGSRWGPGGAQERNGPPRSSPPRRRSPPRRSPAPRRPSPARAGPPPGRRKTRTPPPRRASPPPVRRASPPAVRDRKRERSPTNSVAPSLKRDSASPPRRRARIIPRYECRPTKPVLTSDQVSVVQVRSRYSKLYVPSDFADFSPEWSKRVPLDANIDLSNPVSFHIWNKDVDYILEDGEPETVLDAEDADNRHQVKVLLLSHAGKVEVLKKAFGLLPDGSTDDTHEVTSVFKQLQFLVGCRGKELMAVGGCWSPSLDGVDPTNPATLIKTAIRTTKALTGLDLSNSPQWYSMVQVRYYRADKDRVDRVHLLWPDTQLLMPETATWEGQGAALAAQLEKKLAAVDAMSLKEEKEVEQPVATPVPAKESLVQHQAVHSTEFCEDVEAEKEVKKDDLPASILTPSKDSDCDTSMTDKPKPNATHWNDLDVKTMKVAELKAELEARGLETKGIKTMLAQRLQEVLDKEQELEEDGPPDSEDIVMKDETGEDEHEVDAEVVEVKVEHDVPVKSEEDLKKDAEELQKRVEKLEKEKKERKIALEKHYTMPKDIKAMVYPSKTAKSGKFDCKIVSLQTLLEYRQDDNKESQFEVSLFAEAFKEMLERQAAFTIYQSITIAGEKDCERKKRDEAKGRGEKEKSESQDGKDKSEPEKKEEEKPLEKVELKSVVSNRALFEACAMFDINLCSYITERDLEEILYNGEFGITRGQVTRLAHKLCSRDRINYRNLTDNLVDSEGNVKYTPGYCDGAPDVDVLMKGFGLNYTIAENLQWNGNATIDFVHSSSSDGTIVINGNVINVSQKLALLKKSEQERDSAKASLHEQTSLIAQLREFKQELEKKKRDLEKELDKTKKKLTDTGSALKTSIEDGAHLRSAIADVRRYAERTLTVVDKACPPPSPRKEEKEKKSDEKQPKNSTIEKEDEEIPADALVLSDEAGPDAEITDPETPANGVEVPLNPSVSVNGESPTVTNTPGEHSLATEPDVVISSS